LDFSKGKDDKYVGSKDAKRLAEALQTNTSVQRLSLKDNEIGKKGIKFLMETMQKNVHLGLVELVFIINRRFIY